MPTELRTETARTCTWSPFPLSLSFLPTKASKVVSAKLRFVGISDNRTVCAGLRHEALHLRFHLQSFRRHKVMRIANVAHRVQSGGTWTIFASLSNSVQPTQFVRRGSDQVQCNRNAVC